MTNPVNKRLNLLEKQIEFIVKALECQQEINKITGKEITLWLKH